jgi:hypothetical protein
VPDVVGCAFGKSRAFSEMAQKHHLSTRRARKGAGTNGKRFKPQKGTKAQNENLISGALALANL